MENALVIVDQPGPPAELAATLELAADFARASKARSWRRTEATGAYSESWCNGRGLAALPATAEGVCGFLADGATRGRRASTLGRRLAAVRYFHRAVGLETPTGDEKVKAVLSGIRRTIGAAPTPKRVATSDIVLGMVGGKGSSLRELRDRAILLFAFSGAFRRSELVALNLEDIEWTTEGALVLIRRSETDQEALGRKVGIPRGEIACPVTALEAWLEAAGIGGGAVFRRVLNRRVQRVTDQRLAARNVASVVKAAAAKLGFDPATFGGHSLRSGLVTTAGKARREPDEGLRPDRPQIARDAARVPARCRAVRRQCRGRTAVKMSYRQ